MTRFFIAMAALALFSGAARALPDALAAQTCHALELQMVQPFNGDVYFGISKPGVIEKYVGQGPMLLVLEAALADLDTDAKRRIRWPLAVNFVAECTSETKLALSETVTVGDAMNRAIIRLELDRDVPRWGLPDLPGVDYENHTCLELVDAVRPLGSDVWLKPVNDPVVIAGRRALELYDLSTADALEKSVEIRKSIILAGMDNPTASCTSLFHMGAEKLGLRRK